MLNFKNWPVGRKLRLMNYVLLVNMLWVGGMGYWISHRLDKYLDRATTMVTPSVKHIGALDMIHEGVAGLAYRSMNTDPANEEQKQAIIELEQSYATDIDTLFKDLAAKDLGEEIHDSLTMISKLFTSYLTAEKATRELAFAGKKAEAEVKLKETAAYFESLDGRMERAGNAIEDLAAKLDKESMDFIGFSNWLNLLVLLQGLIVGLALPWYIIRSITRTMEHTITDLTSEAGQVREYSGSIRVSSENLSSATTEQASALQETASSIEEMNAMVKKSTENANKSQDVSKQSHTAAGRGKEAVESMMKAIEEINASNDNIMKQTDESNRKIADIVKVIQEIGTKTKIINDIVFQTKLLSFNASVEAARAGEHGKGFAVVAEEVGNLAAVSGNASKEISEMLDGSIKQVESIIGETKRSIERLITEGKSKVQHGTTVAKQCAGILDEVVNNVTHVDSMIQEIATASREQSQGISEITRAMNQLDQVTHQNSTTSTQVASASERLADQSDQLMGVVDALKIFVYGANGSAAPAPSSSPKMVLHPAAAEKIMEMEPEPTEEMSAEVKMEPITKPAKNVPGVALGDSKMKWKKAGGMDSIPSEDDQRFKDV